MNMTFSKPPLVVMTLIPSSSVYPSPARRILLLSVHCLGHSVSGKVSHETTTPSAVHLSEHVEIVIMHQ
jgi:hypothetical protein